MKKVFLLLCFIIISLNANAFESYNFSAIFGSSNLSNPDGEETYGSGFSLRSEWFVDESWGMLISGGSYTTESDTLGGSSTKYNYNAIFAQTGAFLYFADYFRVAGGLGLSQIDETKTINAQTTNNSYSNIGPFYQIGFKYPLRPMVVGMDYIWQSYGDFTQKGLFFMFGFII